MVLHSCILLRMMLMSTCYKVLKIADFFVLVNDSFISKCKQCCKFYRFAVKSGFTMIWVVC